MKRNYAGPASNYLRMNFTRPKKTSVYIKMLFEILNAGSATRNEVLFRLGYYPSFNTDRYPNWQIFQAMLENKLIKNVGKKNFHRYILTEKGEDLLEKTMSM